MMRIGMNVKFPTGYSSIPFNAGTLHKLKMAVMITPISTYIYFFFRSISVSMRLALNIKILHHMMALIETKLKKSKRKLPWAKKPQKYSYDPIKYHSVWVNGINIRPMA